MFGLFYPYGIALQAIAILHFVRRRPDTYWLLIIRAAGLRAHALAKVGEREKADALFADVTQTSTLSETQYNYACFLTAEGRAAEAREWAERILRKKATMPDYIRRLERPWFRRARALLKRLPRT